MGLNLVLFINDLNDPITSKKLFFAGDIRIL